MQFIHREGAPVPQNSLTRGFCFIVITHLVINKSMSSVTFVLS